MKGFKLFGALFLMVSLWANAARADDSSAVSGRFIGGVGLGGAPTLDGFGPAYSGGAGIDGYIGFVIDKNLSVLLAIDSFIFNTSDPNFYLGEVNIAPSLKYAFGDSKTRFYLIGGIGVNDDIVYYDTIFGQYSANQRNFMIEPGAGVEIYLNGALDLYLQAKYVDVFASGSFSYLPITIGLNFK